VVERLLAAAGFAVRVPLRKVQDSPGIVAEYVLGDLERDEGVDEAIDGASLVVHCAASQKRDEIKAQSLCRAARIAAVEHLVFILVVGADRVRVRSGTDRVIPAAADHVTLTGSTLRCAIAKDLLVELAASGGPQ
jgi:hypothetical protein